MYKGVTKIQFIIAIVVSLCAISCNQTKKVSNEAKDLYTQAQSMYDSGKYAQSLILIDSLNKKYPTELEILKEGLHLRTMAIEKETLHEIISNDSTLNESTEKVESLKGKFKYTKTPEMVEGYRVHSSASPLFNRTGIDVRISDNDSIYIISLVHGPAIGHNQISFSSSTGEIRSKVVPYNGSTNYKFTDGNTSNEMVTFRGAQADSLCNYVIANLSQNIRLNFIGKSRISTTLSASDKRIIAETAEYSEALRNMKRAEAKKRFLDNKLQIAKAQIEKTKMK